MLKNKARFVAEKGMELIGNHDSYTARLLALEVLPKNLKFPTKPFVPEAEAFLRNSLRYDDAVLEGHTNVVYSASFSPDGSRVVSASWDNTIRIWDVSTGSVLTTLEGHTNWVISASFSPDGSRVVSASVDKTIRIWDVSTGSVLKTLGEHTASVNSAFFSPDGSRVVSVSDDGTIRIWDVSTGVSVLKTLAGHTNWVNSASFSPDGSRVVFAAEKAIQIFDFPPLQELIDQTREQFKNRKLTPEERRKYYLE